MMKILRSQKGFTMLELMIVVAVSTVITMSLFMAMRLGNDQLEAADLTMTIQDSAREGLYKMIQEIRESAPDRIAIGANMITFSVPDPNNPINTTTYQVNWPGHSIRYALGGTNNTQIIRTNQTTGATSVIANDVTGLTFTGNQAQPTIVTVTMSVQRTMKNTRTVPANALQLTAQAKIRNP